MIHVRMRSSSGFLNQLQHQLELLSFHDLERLNRPGGLEITEQISLMLNPIDVSVVDPDPIEDSLTQTDESFERLGEFAIRQSEVGLCIDAGEVDENGFPICMKRPLLPSFEATTLSLILNRNRHVSKIWIIAPFQHTNLIASQVLDMNLSMEVSVLSHHETLTLTPDNLIDEADGFNFGPDGSGGIIPALVEAQEIQKFREMGGTYIAIIDGSNILADADPVLIGHHVISGFPVTSQIARRRSREACGIACSQHGINQIVESFRIETHEHNFGNWRSTGTYVVSADIDFSVIDWKWHPRKQVRNGRVVVQYKRYIDDLTSTYKTQFSTSSRKNFYYKQ